MAGERLRRILAALSAGDDRLSAGDDRLSAGDDGFAVRAVRVTTGRRRPPGCARWAHVSSV